MADKTDIEWTDATWNPITGCTIVSAGCTNCYAMGLAGTRLKHHPSRAGLTRISGGRPVWTGKVRLNAEWLDQPLRWRRPRRIFVCAHGDLFHESVPDAWIDRVFAVMALAPQHTFQVLTKRPERMRNYINSQRQHLLVEDPLYLTKCDMGSDPWDWWNRGRPNVWLGTSIEDQPTADARIPHLLATPAAVRFVSAEPLLGPVDLTWALPDIRTACCHQCGFRTNAIGGTCPNDGSALRGDIGLDWVIVGGESGNNARPMHPQWARSLRDQCIASGVAFHFKQWGEFGAGSVNISTGELVFRAFPDFQTWVNKASTWVNGGICLDAKGRQCSSGADMMRARDEGAFPVTIMKRIGKRAAGRTLDGRTWDQMPGVEG